MKLFSSIPFGLMAIIGITLVIVGIIQTETQKLLTEDLQNTTIKVEKAVVDSTFNVLSKRIQYLEHELEVLHRQDSVIKRSVLEHDRSIDIIFRKLRGQL